MGRFSNLHQYTFNVLNDVLKILKKFQEQLYNGVSVQKTAGYKLQTSAVCLYKVVENSSNKYHSRATFYRSRRYRLSSQIAFLNSFLENFQGGLQVHLKKAPSEYVTGYSPKFLLRFLSRTNFITQTRLKLVKK